MPSLPTKTSTFTRSVAILTGPSTHLDHLGVLSHLLQIPLVVVENKTYELAQKYYPQIDTTLIDLADLSMEYLCGNFDVIFETGKFWALELKPFMQLLFKKEMRFVFCPHGNSDKGHSFTDHPDQDISLVYGEHLRDHLTRNGAIDKIGSIAATGNYRLFFYQQHKSFYDEIVEKEIFSRFKEERKTILYAPTWQDRENPTSFFEATDKLIAQLSSSYNLLIKLHPFLIEDHLPHILAMQSRYENHPSAIFIEEFPPIYPLLNRCSIYIGDYSSIGYDFLAFDRPLYFFNPLELSVPVPRYTGLATCGIQIPHTEKDNLKNFIEQTWTAQANFSPMRKNLYDYAFGQEKTPADLEQQIRNCLKRNLS